MILTWILIHLSGVCVGVIAGAMLYAGRPHPRAPHMTALFVLAGALAALSPWVR